MSEPRWVRRKVIGPGKAPDGGRFLFSYLGDDGINVGVYQVLQMSRKYTKKAANGDLEETTDWVDVPLGEE